MWTKTADLSLMTLYLRLKTQKMKLGRWFNMLKMPKAKVKTPFIDMEFTFENADKKAAWALYIELITRVTTQRLEEGSGDEKGVLTSLSGVFQLTRDVLKDAGPDCVNFAKIATVILNHVIRPFTSKWHPISLTDAFTYPGNIAEFRSELADLQDDMRVYIFMLADIIGIEDISGAEPFAKSEE